MYNDLTLFVGIIEALERYSPDANVFVLIHKMDLVAEDDREREFTERAKLVQSKTNQ
jgi:Ras-related GTP-binding protein A/B